MASPCVIILHMTRSKKLINNAENHLVVGSLEVLGEVTGRNIKTIRRTVNSLQTDFKSLSTKQKDYWSALSDDGIITSFEKILLKQEWDCINTTYAALRQEAISKQVQDTSTIIAYMNAYEALRTYLFSTLKIFDEMSADTNIDNRVTFNSYFSTYYATENLVQTALIAGVIERLEFFTTVDNLDFEGTENQLVIYAGEIYQWLNGRWKKIGTNGYCGSLSTLPTEIEGNYFIAAQDFFIDVYLLSPANEKLLAPNGDFLMGSEKIERAFIYEFANDKWRKIADDTDYRYIVAFSDYYNLTGKMPAVWQNTIDGIQEQLDDLDDAQTAQGNLVETYKSQILSELDAQTAQLRSDITSANTTISTLTSQYDGLAEDIDDILADNQVTATELETLRNKYRFTQQDFDDLSDALDEVSENLTTLESAYNTDIAQVKADIISHNTTITSLSSQYNGLADDITNILDDNEVTAQELQSLSDKYDLSDSQISELSDALTSVSNTLQTVTGETIPGLNTQINSLSGNISATQQALKDYITSLLAGAIYNIIWQNEYFAAIFQTMPESGSGDYLIDDIYELVNDYHTVTENEARTLAQKYNISYTNEFLSNLRSICTTVQAIEGYEEDVIKKQAITNTKDLISLWSTYPGLQEDVQRILDDGYVTQEELDEVANKYSFTEQDFINLQSGLNTLQSITIPGINDVLAGKVNTSTYNQFVSSIEQDLNAKVSQSVYDQYVTNTATALANLQSTNQATEAEIQTMLNSMTAAEFAALISQYGSDVSAIQTALAAKIEHIPVYYGSSTNVPITQALYYGDFIKGDYFLYNETTVNGTINNDDGGVIISNSGAFKNGYIYVFDHHDDETDNDYFNEKLPNQFGSSNYYMTALKDMFANTPATSGTFHVLFANAFFANTAVLNALKVTQIIIGDGGSIESANYTAGVSGFNLDGETGNIELNNGNFRGLLKTKYFYIEELNEQFLVITETSNTDANAALDRLFTIFTNTGFEKSLSTDIFHSVDDFENKYKGVESFTFKCDNTSYTEFAWYSTFYSSGVERKLKLRNNSTSITIYGYSDRVILEPSEMKLNHNLEIKGIIKLAVYLYGIPETQPSDKNRIYKDANGFLKIS